MFIRSPVILHLFDHLQCLHGPNMRKNLQNKVQPWMPPDFRYEYHA